MQYELLVRKVQTKVYGKYTLKKLENETVACACTALGTHTTKREKCRN